MKMQLKKINLPDFEAMQMSVTELLNVKGGSGSTRSRRYNTTCTGSDKDGRATDSD